jgi:nitrate reductase alpha subunit
VTAFRPRKVSIVIDDPDEAENFLRGLIVARSNNSSQYFVDLIDGVNAIMENYRGEIMKEQMAAREAAGMP